MALKYLLVNQLALAKPYYLYLSLDNKYHMINNMQGNTDYRNIQDCGSDFFSADINKIVINNENFLSTLWTGNNTQIT